MSSNSKAITTAVIVALIAAILLTLQQHTINRLNEQLAQKSSGLAVPVNPPGPMVVIAPSSNVQVAAPSLPPAPVSNLNSATAARSALLQQQVAIALAGEKTVTNNLRMLATASEQYMLDRGVTQAAYYDIVGTTTDSYIRSIEPAGNEHYEDFILYQTQTQVTQVAPDGSIVTYNL